MKRRKKKKWLSTVIIVVMLMAGVGLLLYPTVSNWWNERVQSRAIATYSEAVDLLDDDEYAAILEAAESYNERLAELGSSLVLYSPGVVEGYKEMLDVSGNGVMGYITVEKIDLQLPIYHGTSSEVLANGAGHLEGSSLPIGGMSTHTVLSGHRGLPSATLFTNLDQMEIGDTFTITVLNELLTYEVDQIKTVLPDETEDLYIEEGRDYCTLVTCTPYGINTHRLLIRGHRIENATESVPVKAEAYEVEPLIVALFIGAFILIIILIIFLIYTRKRRKNGRGSKHKKANNSQQNRATDKTAGMTDITGMINMTDLTDLTDSEEPEDDSKD